MPVRTRPRPRRSSRRSRFCRRRCERSSRVPPTSCAVPSPVPPTRPGVALVRRRWSMATGVIRVALPVRRGRLAGRSSRLRRADGRRLCVLAVVAPQLDRLDPIAGLARLSVGERLFGVLRALVAAFALAALAVAELRERMSSTSRASRAVCRWTGPVVAGRGRKVCSGEPRSSGWRSGSSTSVVTRRAWLGRLQDDEGRSTPRPIGMRRVTRWSARRASAPTPRCS